MGAGINYLFPLPRMKKQLLIAICCLVVTTTVTAQDDASKALWPAETPAIDGQINDWPTPFNLYDGATGALFAIANDSTNLYLCVTAADNYKVAKMMQYGWEIVLSCKDKNRKVNAEIAFPTMQQTDNNQNTAPGLQRNINTLVSLYRAQFTTVKANGFRTQNGILNVTGTTGIKIQTGVDSVQGLVYEIAIPLAELMDPKFITLNEQFVLTLSVIGVQLKAVPADNSGWDNGGTNIRQSTTGSMNRIDAMNGVNQNPNDLSSPGADDGRVTTRAVTDRTTLKQKFRLVAGKQ